MHMRMSRVLRKMRAGEVATCTKINLADSRAVEIAGLVGFDCVWLDMEHVPNDWETLENQIRAAKVHDMDSLTRVARGSYSDYIKPLEADSAGIMIPHIMSAEDARKVIHYTRFQPIGRRPMDSGNVDGAFCMVDHVEYAQTANKERFIIVQIEDPEPLDELDEIASIEGIDMLLFGPCDFSHSIGKLAQWDNPELAETKKRVAKAARDHGKFSGTVSGIADIAKNIDMGYNFITCGADVVALGAYFRDIAKVFEQAKK